MVNLTIKWGSKVLDLDMVPSEGVKSFKDKLQTLTNVPAERQKLMCKLWKGLLKDDVDLSTCAFTDGIVVTLMGDASTQAAAPKIVFAEDLPVSKQKELGAVVPAGLVNEGNTCYMNSVLQCIRSVPELRSALRAYRPHTPGSSNGAGGGAADASTPAAVDLALADLMTRIDGSTDAARPLGFLSKLRAHYPKFAEMTQMGGYKQHDAEEFQSVLLNALASELTSPTPDVKAPLKSMIGSGAPPNVVDTLFGLEMEVKMVCTESKEEATVVKYEGYRKLSANIDGGAGKTTQINHLHDALLHGLTGELEKRSDLLGRNAIWTRNARISRLPKYISVHMIRFFWKKITNVADAGGVGGVPCKILKPVSFPDTLDVLDLCTDKVKKLLTDRRSQVSDLAASAKLGSPSSSSSAKSTSSSATTTTSSSSSITGAGGGSSSSSSSMDSSNNTDELAAALRMSMMDEGASGAISSSSSSSTTTTSGGGGDGGSSSNESMVFGAGLTDSFRGTYELFAVVTHKGRDSSSGHYMGWVRQTTGKGKNDEWCVFDDDSVSPTDTETVLSRLKGGGDEHMGYILFYRAVQ